MRIFAGYIGWIETSAKEDVNVSKVSAACSMQSHTTCGVVISMEQITQ